MTRLSGPRPPALASSPARPSFSRGRLGAAQRGFAPNDLAGTGADTATQLAIVQGGFLLTNAATFLASLALFVWLASVAFAARRERTLSSRLIVATWLAALAPIASAALTGFPFGLLITIPYMAVLGISLLRRARQSEATAAGFDGIGSFARIEAVGLGAGTAPCLHPA